MEEFNSTRPVIGITPDLTEEKYHLSRHYSDMVVRAGGTPIVLASRTDCLQEYIHLCGGFILSGGDDPDMTPWGVPTHVRAKPIDPDRQRFELALLKKLDGQPQIATLGVCLGMQLMGLHAGGQLDQYLPESLSTADLHWNKQVHEVNGKLGAGIVHSHHRQALSNAGSLQVVAQAPDGVIEAVRNNDRSFYLGIQWHPERTEDPYLGFGLIQGLVHAARAAREPLHVM